MRPVILASHYQMHLYGAVLRSMSNSRSHPTRHLFMESLKCARKCGAVYTEGLAFLEMCVCLRSEMPAATLRSQLELVSFVLVLCFKVILCRCGFSCRFAIPFLLLTSRLGMSLRALVPSAT